MQKLRVESFSVSVDGFGAGPYQSLENPLGIGGADIQQWFFPTKTFQQQVLGKDEGTTGIDDNFAAHGFNNIGAWVMGRNMFGPIRGPWTDEDWKGWWGDNPPFHSPVFVLTHHKRDPVEMSGGTTFYFVTEGIRAALDRAFTSAEGKDVRLGGGVSTVKSYLEANLVDEMHIVISPVLLGSGERLFSEIDLVLLGYECTGYVPTESAAHIFIKRLLLPDHYS